MQEELLESMFRNQEQHWWFTTKRNIVVDQIDRYIDPFHNMSILDIGCGSGLMIQILNKYGTVFGMDTSEQSIEFCKKLGGTNLALGALPKDIPFEANKFEMITALDVIEHIDDDGGSLIAIIDLLKNDGLLILTVPALNLMWTNFDEINDHKRRYSKSELRRKLKLAGFEVEFISYYNSILFPLAFVGRMYSKLFGVKSKSELEPPFPFINRVLAKVFGLELYILRFFSFPVGLSLIAVARKSSHDGNCEPIDGSRNST